MTSLGRRRKGETAMKKRDLLELLRGQPDDIDIDALIYTLYVRQKIEHALAEAEHDEGMDHEEFVRESAAWFD